MGQDSEVGPGPFRLSWAQPEPVLRLQCDTLKTCVFTAISDVFGFEVRVRPGCPHWACLGPNLGAKWPHTGPRCACQAQLAPKTCPNCAMLDPSWAQVGPKLEPTGPSSVQVRRKLGASEAPVRPNLRPRTAKFDPSRLLVGPSRPASFLSLSYSLGAVLVAKRLEYISKSL